MDKNKQTNKGRNAQTSMQTNKQTNKQASKKKKTTSKQTNNNKKRVDTFEPKYCFGELLRKVIFFKKGHQYDMNKAC